MKITIPILSKLKNQGIFPREEIRRTREVLIEL